MSLTIANDVARYTFKKLSNVTSWASKGAELGPGPDPAPIPIPIPKTTRIQLGVAYFVDFGVYA